MAQKGRLMTARARLIAAAVAMTIGWQGVATARPFIIGQGVETQTLDPHGTTETNTLGVIMNIYEALVRRDRTMAIEPALATEWHLINPTTWRFKLRQGVVFQDGSALTAADVVFSLKRALSATSDARAAVHSIDHIDVIDDHTVDIVTQQPNPILLPELCNFFIMSKDWAEAHDAAIPYTPTRAAGVENYATRHADGTGPYALASYDSSQSVNLVANKTWWDKKTNDLTEVTFAPIGSNATRVAALLSGKVDMINPVPEQDTAQIEANPQFHIIRGERPAVMYLGLDSTSAQLKYGAEGAGNPFRDVRVRRAIYAAIDATALRRVVMRNAAEPAGSMIPKGVEGFEPAMADHPAPDVAMAKQLMAEAGYAKGFAVTLDCTNDQYPQDETVCIAIGPMLARIGITVTTRADSRARFFPRVTSGDTSFYLMAWYSPTFDAQHILWNTLETKTKIGGSWNATGWSNPEFDGLVQKIDVEMDQAKRRALISQANALERKNMIYLPLYQLTQAVAVKAGVSLVLRPDARVDLRFVTVK
jgi:peptide/nickel transport system substrate-binding protein